MLSVLALAAALLQQQPGSGYFPDKIGEWARSVDGTPPAKYAVAPAQVRAFNARVSALEEILHAAPVFHPPLGFQPKFSARWYWPGACERGADCSRIPAQLQSHMGFYYFVPDLNGKPSWGGEASVGAEVLVNDLDQTFGGGTQYSVFGAPYLLLPDGRIIRYRPWQSGTFSGFPVYDTLVLVIARPDRPAPWVPVTREQYLRALIRFHQNERDTILARNANTRDPYAAFVRDRENRRRARDAAYARIKAGNAAQAEAFLQQSLRMEAEMEAALKKAAPTLAMKGDPVKLREDFIAGLTAELNAMPPAERASPARVGRTPDNGYWPPLTPAGAGIELVASNPAYFDATRPRTDWQVVAVVLHWRGHSWDFFAVQRLRQFLEQTDWRRVSNLLGSAPAATGAPAGRVIR